MDFYNFLLIPASIKPTDCVEKVNYKLDLMVKRSIATRDFVEGRLNYNQFEQALDYYNEDPINCYNHWYELETQALEA